MSEALVTQFGEPDAPYCDPTTARVTLIPAPLEYSVSYMKGTERGPQAILDASSQMELYDEELDCCPIEIGVYTRPPLDYSDMDHAAALKVTGEAVREVLERGQLPFIIGGEHSLSAPPIALDPSEMPAVGTPEPGGLHWYQLLDLFHEICQRTTIVGMDMVELCPMAGQTRADFLAARLVYKMIGYRFCDNPRTPGNSMRSPSFVTIELENTLEILRR
jgi:arginase family enzyme